MSRLTPRCFEFYGLRFYPDQACIVRERDGARSYIRPKQQALLNALLSRPGETVTYQQLWTTIWTEIEDFDAVRRTMTETKSNLDRLLRSILKTDAPIIQTISGQGYCVKASVTKRWREDQLIEQLPAVLTDVESAQTASPARSSLLGPHPWHEVIACCALKIEVARTPKSQFFPVSSARRSV